MAKFLLISVTTPGNSCVGEIILRDMLQFLEAKQICCFTVIQQPYNHSTCPCLDEFPYLNMLPFHERPRRKFNGRIGSFEAYLNTRLRLEPYVDRVIKQAAEFGKKHEVSKVWVILESPTMIAMGSRVADLLGVPMISLVWDLPEYLMRLYGMDSWSIRHLMKQFGQALCRSEKVAVVSEQMKNEFERHYGTRCVIVRHGLPQGSVVEAGTFQKNAEDFVIGFAGGLYAKDAWDALIRALDKANWKIGSNRVKIKTLGGDLRIKSCGPARVEYLGWRDNEEVRQILSQCDVNYLPQPFSDSLLYLAKFSFPTKLSTYLAAGRPVFIHAPSYASLSEFIQEHPFGVSCHTLAEDDIICALNKLAMDEDIYVSATAEVVRTARTKFNHEHFRRCFLEFTGLAHIENPQIT